jgi:hypothetical protein
VRKRLASASTSRPSRVRRYLARRKEKLADIEILESNPRAVEDGDIVLRDPARTAPFKNCADRVQNKFAACQILEKCLLVINATHIPCRPVVHEAKIARVSAIAAAQHNWRVLYQVDRSTATSRSNRSTESSATSAYHQNINGPRLWAAALAAVPVALAVIMNGLARQHMENRVHEAAAYRSGSRGMLSALPWRPIRHGIPQLRVNRRGAYCSQSRLQASLGREPARSDDIGRLHAEHSLC